MPRLTLKRASVYVATLLISLTGTTRIEAAQTKCLSECTPRLGIVSAFGAEADILLAQTHARKQWNINGKHFTTGELRGNKVVIVLSGVSIVNAAMTTQLMLDHFRIGHLLLTGIAGGVNPANHVGDVLVPERWALPMETYWNGDGSIPSACGKPGELECLGLKLARNKDGQPLPEFRIGALSTGVFLRENHVVSSANSPQGEYRFDYEADPQMLAVARSLEPRLNRCGPHMPRQCVSEQPQLRIGGRGISGSAFLANPDYRSYLHQTLTAEAMDMETAALAHVAYANGIPFIAFRSLSDLAGGTDFKDVGAFFGSGLAEANESNVTLAFLEAWKKQAAHRPRNRGRAH